MKILFLGDKQVGKTSFIIKLIHDRFYNDYAGTIGCDFFFTTIEMNNKIINIEIYDASGDNIFDNIVESMYTKADCYVIMFDIQNIDSFCSINIWHDKILLHKKNCPILLIGNKFDIEFNDRYIKYNAMIEFAKEKKMFYKEVSVKDNIDVYNSIYEFIENIMPNNKKKCKIM
ncbi:rab domain-containing protein [Bodo saltans virus]|uniref:Rab domain-containing protein n=1 Tax=Bodo saltans virus TaxID=2024608 RepID=A0A2H4UVY9_9VIRU|nr:rab domain-containing protein [Bodo saltans virus]ATZ81047.1 rab domain-containing protein [Bodo saltans virus]